MNWVDLPLLSRFVLLMVGLRMIDDDHTDPRLVNILEIVKHDRKGC